jgi:hypothetical protein
MVVSPLRYTYIRKSVSWFVILYSYKSRCGAISLPTAAIKTLDSPCAAILLAIVRDFQASNPETRAPTGTIIQKEKSEIAISPTHSNLLSVNVPIENRGKAVLLLWLQNRVER